jgi:uncharacterized protein with HEPN domain
MSERSNELLVIDIRDSINKIMRYTAGMKKAEFMANEMAIDAVIRNFEIIGEAASQISKEFIHTHANVPFRKMNKLRNHLIHGYAYVSLEMLWKEISKDIPAWKTQIEKLK